MVPNFRLLILPTQPRNERQKNNTCLPEKAPGWGGGRKRKKGDLEEMSSGISCQQTTTLPRSFAGRSSQASGRQTDRRTDGPLSPPRSSLLHL